MGKARDAFGLVLAGVRAKLLSGEIAPGQSLSIGDLAGEFRTSVTPVREALTRLAGEGLLVGARRSGFARPGLSVDGLIDLLELHHAEVSWAVQILSGRSALVTGGRTDRIGLKSPSPEKVFVHLVARTGSAALATAHRTTTLQLGPVRRIERAVLVRVDDELQDLLTAADAGAWGSVLQGLVDYHTRRTGAALDLTEAAMSHASERQRVGRI